MDPCLWIASFLFHLLSLLIPSWSLFLLLFPLLLFFSFSFLSFFHRGQKEHVRGMEVCPRAGEEALPDHDREEEAGREEAGGVPDLGTLPSFLARSHVLPGSWLHHRKEPSPVDSQTRKWRKIFQLLGQPRSNLSSWILNILPSLSQNWC